MIGNSNCIGTNFNGSILNITPKELNSFLFLQKKFYISKSDRTYHFVGESSLKELDIKDLKKRKQMNE